MFLDAFSFVIDRPDTLAGATKFSKILYLVRSVIKAARPLGEPSTAFAYYVKTSIVCPTLCQC